MRLNRYLAQATGLSRRGADEIIEAGRVRVNDGLSALGQLVTTSDQVWLDGAPLEMPQEHRYVIFHKPVGTITSRRQQGSTPTIYRQLPADFERLRSVGRLDRDSSGLLVLTDDGDYAHRLSHPSFQKNKRYEANDRHVVVTISEGRNRQIRRSFDALGYTVVKLHRTNLGDLALGDLKPGEWRDFRPEASNNDE
jgi:23S rRNA pseudouridine2605 synthase